MVCLKILFHSCLSSTFALQPIIFILIRSSSTWSIHLNMGLPAGLVLYGVHSVIFLVLLVFSILITWAAHLSLCDFIHFIISSCFILCLNSSFVLILHIIYLSIIIILSWSHCLSGLRCKSAADHLLRLWVQIPPGTWMSICYKCCVSSGRGLCIEQITHPEESYWQWCVVECDWETSRMRRPWPTGELSCQIKKNNNAWWITEIMNLYVTVHSHFLCHFTYFMCQMIFSQKCRSYKSFSLVL